MTEKGTPTTTGKSTSTTVKISSPYAKFFIGVVAGCAAIAIPRLSSYLASGDKSGFNYFPTNYIIAIAVFSIFLGAVIVIMEYGLPKPPKETFFAALAIPGLIAGSLNVTVVARDANKRYNEAYELTKEMQTEENISIEQVESIEIIPIDISENRQQDSSWNFNFELISSAHADEFTHGLRREKEFLGLSVERGGKNFAVSIGSYENKKAAIEEAIAFGKLKSSVVLIKTAKGYELLSTGKLFSETRATIEALRMRKELNIVPKLLQVK